MTEPVDRSRMRLFLRRSTSWSAAADVPDHATDVDHDSSRLSWTIGDVEYLGDLWNLGRVDLLARQARDCIVRLATGRPAILRSAVLGRPGVPFHLIEPLGDPRRVVVTRFFIADPAIESWFPISGWGLDDPEQLFAWVKQHRHELRHRAQPDEEYGPDLVDVETSWVDVVRGLASVVADASPFVGAR